MVFILCLRKTKTQRNICPGFVSVMLRDMSMDITDSSLLKSRSTSNHSTKAHFDFRGTKAAMRCWQICGNAVQALLDAALGKITASPKLAVKAASCKLLFSASVANTKWAASRHITFATLWSESLTCKSPIPECVAAAVLRKRSDPKEGFEALLR